jgi:hypothetical protein
MKRRIARILIDRQLLLDSLRGGGCSLSEGFAGDLLVRYSSADIPKDTAILGVDWDHVTEQIVLICESATFDEVAPGERPPVRSVLARTDVRRITISVEKQ